MPKLSQKGVVHLLSLFVLIIILIAIGFGVYSLRKGGFWIFKSKAGDNVITITNPNGSPLPKDEKDNKTDVTDSLEVQIDLNPLPK